MAELKQRRGLDYGVMVGRFFTDFGMATATAFLYPSSGALGVALATEQGEPIGVLSVNLPAAHHHLQPGEFFLKDYAENESIALHALQSGLFELTPISEAAMYVSFPVARLRDLSVLDSLD